MKLRLIKEALEHYVLSADCSENDREEVFMAISECAQLEERYEDRDLWKDAVSLITNSDLLDFLNFTTYDILGKLNRINDGEAPFESYAREVRRMPGYQLTDGQLRAGYEFIMDLWHDNEAYGCGYNNPDGTFNKN